MKKASSILLAIYLASCSTPYKEMGFGGGVSASQIDSNTLRVVGAGNAFTSSEAVADYVLLKAAEETKRAGYDIFVIIESEDTSSVGAITSPGHMTAYTYGSTTNATFTPGNTTYFTKPGANIIIKSPFENGYG